MTTVAAAARCACEGDRRRALRLLDELVRARELFRYDSVFTTTPTAPKPPDRWRNLAVLSYCCLGNTQRPKIPQEQIATALGDVAARLGIGPPSDKPCIFDRDGWLARLWVEPYAQSRKGLALGTVLEMLQRATKAPSFRVWAYLALSGEFRLLILCRSRRRADELGRWLGRVPLVCRAGPQHVEIPVSTAVIQ